MYIYNCVVIKTGKLRKEKKKSKAVSVNFLPGSSDFT